VVNGGAIPKCSQLTEKYMAEVCSEEVCVLKEKPAGKPVAIIFDETPDPQGRCVVNILVAPLCVDEDGNLRAFLTDTVFLNTVDHRSVSQSVVKVLQQYDISNENVIVINTDSAAYMLKTYKECL